MKAILPLAVLCMAAGVHAQITVSENTAPTGALNEIDFDALPPGPVTVAAINAIGSPNATDIADIILTPNTSGAGIYNTNPALGRALAFVNGGLELIDPPSGAFDPFDAQILLAGPSSEIGIGIADFVSTMDLEFFLGGVSLGSFTTSRYTTADIKYFETPLDLFDEVRVRATSTGGNWVFSGLAIGDSSGVPQPALIAEGFVDMTPNQGATPGVFTDGSTLSWQIRDLRDLLVGTPGAFFINVAVGEPAVGNSTPFLPSQFIQTTSFSNPVGQDFIYSAVAVGGSAGGAAVQSQAIPAGLFQQNGVVLRLQPLVIDVNVPGNFPVRTTNPIRFRFEGPSITVSASGANSFNSDTTEGFFKVVHNDPARASIVRVVFDGTTNGQNFDTDQGAMADLFEGGNSVAAGCAGTYRNGSDIAAGLVYGPMNTVTATPCDPAANTGWIGTNETTTDTFETLEFGFGSFNPGTTFEFDADTDAPGTNGGAMAGMTITIELSDGTILNGTLVADPNDPNRSELSF